MTLKESTEVAQHLATVFAIAGGACWALYRIWLKREDKTKAVLEPGRIDTLRLPDGRYYVRVAIQLRNLGNVPVYPWWTRGIVNRILPTQDLPGVVHGDHAWPPIDHVCYSHARETFVVEPGETSTWWLGHVVPADCEVVELETRVFCSGEKLEDLEQYGFPRDREPMPDLARAARLEEGEKWLAKTDLWETLAIVDLRKVGALSAVPQPADHEGDAVAPGEQQPAA